MKLRSRTSWARKTPRLIGSVLVILLCLGEVHAADTIIPISGRPIRDVQIVSESFKEVVYKLANVPTNQRVPSTRVKEIRHGDTPQAYGTGLEAKDRGEYENAIQSLRLSIEKGKRPWVEEYCLFHIGECYQQWGLSDATKLERAIEVFGELKSKFSESRFLPMAEIALGQCLTASGKYSDAENHFTGLENSARSTYGIEWEIEAKLGNAKNLELQKKYGEARTKYTSISTAARNETRRVPANDAAGEFKIKQLLRLADEARLREGICLIRAGSYGEAQNFYSTMISEARRNKDWTRLGGAYNGRGEALFNEKKYVEAYIDFSQTSAVYFSNPNETAKALYWSGLTREAMDGKPTAKSKEFFQDVVNFFPTSEWAAKAKEKLK